MTHLFSHFKDYSIYRKAFICLIITSILSVSNHSYSQLPIRFNRKSNLKIEKRDSLYGAVDSNGKVLIPFEYQEIVTGWDNENFIVKKNDKYGIIDKGNSILLSLKYSFYDRIVESRPYFEFFENYKYYLFNRYGKLINSEPYDQFQLTYDEVFLVRNNNKQFLMDTNGKIVSNFYSEIRPIGRTRYVVNNDTVATKKDYLIDRSRRDILSILPPFLYFKYQPKSQSQGYYGLIDNYGKEILPLRFNYIGEEGGILMAVQTKGSKDFYGYFDLNGKEVLPIVHDSLSNVIENTIVVKRNNKFCLLNSKGKPHFKINFDSVFFRHIENSRDNYIVVVKNNKYGLINTKGKLIIPLKYDFIGWPNHGLVNAELNNKMGFLDLKGNIKIDFKYDQCSNFLYGYARVSQDNKVGFIDINGKVTIPIIYDASSFLYDSRNYNLDSYFKVKVKLGNRIFFINERNQFIESAKEEK